MDESLNAKAYRMEVAGERRNLTRELADAAREIAALQASVERGEVPMMSDYRRLSATVAEAATRAAALAALRGVECMIGGESA